MMSDIAEGSAVYIDSNIFIYFIEKTDGHFEKAYELLLALAERNALIFTSELTVAECLYSPARDGNDQLVSVYEMFFGPLGDIRLIPLNSGIIHRAARHGGKFGLKLIDAMHYVSAIESGCVALITADRRFKSSNGLAVIWA
jgi:predicted nucleic acid-binding protein